MPHPSPTGPGRRPLRAPIRHTVRRRSALAVAGYAGLGLACLALAALSFLFIAQPVDLLRDRVLARLKVGAGGDLVVAGGASLSMVPRPAVSVANITLAAPADGSRPAVAVERLDAELGFLSLLGGEPSISRLVLTRPTIEVRPNSSPNSRPGPRADAPAPAAGAELGPRGAATAPRGEGGARAIDRLARIGLDSVRIVDGRVRYLDASSAPVAEIGSLEADLALGVAGAVQAKGSFLLRGERLAFTGEVPSLPALLREQATRLKLTLAGGPLEATFAGELTIGHEASLDGRLGLTVTSARALAAWLGEPSDALPDPGALRLAAALTLGEGRLSLAELDATVGDTPLAGDLTLETKRARPYLSGALRLAELNVGRLLLRPGPAVAVAAGGVPVQPAGRPQVEKRANGDWSDERIDLKALPLADADLTLSVERVAYKDLATGPSTLRLGLENGFAKVTLDDMQLYGGRAQGVVTLDATNPTPAIGGNLTLEGISVLPLLRDGLGFEWLEGSGGIALALAGRGESVRQVVAGLNGKVAVNVGNGSIRGTDFAKVLRGLEQGRLEALGAAEGDKTQFSEFAATFVVASGVATNQDLRLLSPRLQVAGSGSAALARRSIDYTARVRIVGGVSVPGAVLNVANLEIPLRIEGPWSKPHLSVVGQENLAETVKQIGKNLNSQDVQEAIKGLFGGDGQRTKPSDLIDKLLKKP
jgi:AsmA protein